jgi:hypothetical protein
LGQLEATSGEIRRRPFRYVYFPQNALPTLVRQFGLSAVDYIRHGKGENSNCDKRSDVFGQVWFQGFLGRECHSTTLGRAARSTVVGA